jgi:glycosyltransferase involved in cell wall biosynthesis
MPPINLWCPTLDTIDSYGRLADELSRGLEEAGWTPNEFCLSELSRKPVVGVEMVAGGVLLGIPPIFQVYPTLAHIGPTLAMTMFESTRIPADWIEPLNRCHGVVVPSAFLIDVFRSSGVTIPIHVVNLGISQAFHQYKDRVLTTTEEEPFTFIAIADRGVRKNWGVAAGAFNKAFGNDMRYRLILKSRTGVINYPITNPNIDVIAQDMSDEELCQLYHRAHVMIFPSRGEGFGFPPREFTATGGLALATNWSGTADEIDQWGIPIPYTMEPAYPRSKGWAGTVGDWAVPDLDHLAQQLRHVADTYATLASEAPQRAQFVKETYSWQRFGQRVGEIYDRLCVPSPVLS